MRYFILETSTKYRPKYYFGKNGFENSNVCAIENRNLTQVKTEGTKYCPQTLANQEKNISLIYDSAWNRAYIYKYVLSHNTNFALYH